MPLSKCRNEGCGKMVPNPYRPYHEKVACLVLKRKQGLLTHRDLPKVRKPKDESLPEGQTKLGLWFWKNGNKWTNMHDKMDNESCERRGIKYETS